MKKCKCKCGCKILKLLAKLFGVLLLANVALFVVFFFDLDGKLLFHVVEPFLKKHYDNMERKDTLKTPYDVAKYVKPDYDK
ncbi:MAG: hypothetical protein MJ135_06885 [Oscillospiraceae bacterium]|nr:hypothetical protein [Oscillospiraceae bacterium]